MKRLLLCLLSLVSTHCLAEQVSNMAIVWGQAFLDSQSEVVGANSVIPSALNRLFQSRATPIIVNNCWARILLSFFAAAQESRINQTTTTLANAYQKACRSRQKKEIQKLQKQLVAHAHQAWQSFDRETDITAKLTQLQTISRLTRTANQNTADEQTRVAIAGGYGFNYLFACAQATDLNAWNLYLFNGPRTMLIFVPKSYGASALSLDRCTRVTIGQAEQLLASIPVYEEDNDTIVSAFSQLFSRNNTNPINMILIGHGAPQTDAAPAAMTAILHKSPNATSSIMAGMPNRQFYKLIDLIRTIKAHVVVWLTCFGGGNNAQGVAQILNIGSAVNKTAQQPIAISLAPADRSMYARTDAQFSRFFELLAQSWHDRNNQQRQKELLTQAIRSISNETAIVLWPRAHTFEPLA